MNDIEQEKWFRELYVIAEPYGYSDLDFADWEDYYESGYSPREALNEDLSCA